MIDNNHPSVLTTHRLGPVCFTEIVPQKMLRFLAVWVSPVVALKPGILIEVVPPVCGSIEESFF